ncbi:Sec7 guanine nucleotide exchange factor [Rhizoctonia solani]|uniref:Sec7 guanine nucleotide exchange factor n=1 Tax=Rhizoctonia solani TaxID=456999 RepID=A0A8H8T148_9AGAM|nr:Sec7 guanine nucleotide exchange factor [Rhizoctonia solani]QRW24133.1 Sec7 guanine nucleotide exchange factor [Rhizoctonia solani]
MSLFNRSNHHGHRHSAFKLSGVASTEPTVRRVSRTHDDFEAALRSEDTVVLQEGRDMHTLGHADTPHRNRSGSVNLTAPTGLYRRHRPSPDCFDSETLGVQTHPCNPCRRPPYSHAPEEDDSRRRSIRSREEQPEERERTRSTTSSAFEIIEAHTPSKSRDRALTSPDSQGQRRTTASQRLKKHSGYHCDVGEGRSDREGKRSTPTTPVATQQHSFAPPVPTIPLEYRSSPPQQAYFPTNTQQSLLSTQLSDSPAQTPSLPSADPFIADTCSTQSSPLITPTASSSQPMNGPRHMKPLPPIQKQFPPVPVDDRSDTDDDTPLAPRPNPPARLDQSQHSKVEQGLHRTKTKAPLGYASGTTGGANREAALASAATTNVAPRELDHSATLTQRSHARPSFPRQSKDGRRRSMSRRAASPPRASMDDAVANNSESDEDRTEEGHPPRAPVILITQSTRDG